MATLLLGGCAPLVRSDPQQLARRMAPEEANARAAGHHAFDTAHAERLLQMLPAWRALFEVNGRYDEGLATLRALLQLPETDAAATRLLTHGRQVFSALLYQRGLAADALRYVEAGIESAQRCGEYRPLVGCLNTAALALYLLGCDEDALADLNRALPIALELGHGAQIRHLYNIIGNHHRALGRWAEARTNLHNGLRISEEHGLTAAVLFCSVNLALTEIERGELDTAARRLAALMARLNETPQQQVRFDAELGLARIDIRQGRRPEVRERLLRLDAMAREAAQSTRRLQALSLWGEALLHEGRLEEAVRLLRWLAELPALSAVSARALRRQLESVSFAPRAPWPQLSGRLHRQDAGRRLRNRRGNSGCRRFACNTRSH